MPSEFPAGARPAVEFADGAMQALDANDGERHDAAVVAAAGRLRDRGCEAIALAQFSLARAVPAVIAACGLPVWTTIDSAVAALRRRLG